jgi:hypothetical protein
MLRALRLVDVLGGAARTLACLWNPAASTRMSLTRGAIAVNASGLHIPARCAMSACPTYHEARTRILAEPRGVAGFGFAVGYDSPSQFSREYRRLFGVPPSRDALALRGPTALPPIRRT